MHLVLQEYAYKRLNEYILGDNRKEYFCISDEDSMLLTGV